MSAPAPLSTWAHRLIEALVSAGVGHAVICPGSRSTPFAWAALGHPNLECVSLLDERSAAFFALGQARLTGRPSLVITTSGTAAANCLPAVVEARLSATPLLVLTADRPPELQDCGAPQTIDQVKLFGDQTRYFSDLGLPDPGAPSLRALQRKAAQAVMRCTWPVPGPAHLNAPARKPLEPSDDPASPAGLGAGTAIRVPDLQLSDANLQLLVKACQRSRRGVLLCGPTNPAQALDAPTVAEVTRATGMVVICEAASQLRLALPPALRGQVFDGYDLAHRIPEFRTRAAPDFVLQIGAPPISAPCGEYLSQHRCVPRWVVAPHDFVDPTNAAATLLVAAPAPTLRSLATALSGAKPPSADATRERKWWLDLHRTANDAVWEAVEQHLDPHPGALTEAQAVRETVDSLPRSALLVLGNSLPIREVEAYCRARTGDTRVCSQRGANGIDGILSGAAGAAHASRRPTTVLLGDVSFLHDLGGLWAARDLDTPFVVVVVNNDGGRIFEQLPVATMRDVDELRLRYWTTPHGLRLARAGDLFGYPAEPVNTTPELSSALGQAHARPGCTLIEARVRTHDARDSMRDLREAVAARLLPALDSPSGVMP